MSNRILPVRVQVYFFAFLAVCCLAGCGGSDEPTATEDPAPFLQAVEKYLDRNNMAMSVKEVKTGPTVDGNTATLTASFTRSEVGGPARTWTFTFEKDAHGVWIATNHE